MTGRQVVYVLLCILFSSQLAGCSRLKLAYQFADRLALIYVNRYTDLERPQKVSLRPYIQQRMLSHRREELPLYVAFLDDTYAAAADGLTRTEVEEVFESVTTLYKLAKQNTVPVGVQIL
ncbi:MAG: hypothetical protein MJA83_00530, partial [Gammaproteobacteria bacterium]|nr:hypothetical protein [Gammaproteobacteria bacterium]